MYRGAIVAAQDGRNKRNKHKDKEGAKRDYEGSKNCAIAALVAGALFWLFYLYYYT